MVNHFRLLWIYAFSVLLTNAFVNTTELKAFENFLNFRNIKYAIIIKRENCENRENMNFKAKDFEYLYQSFRLRFYVLGSRNSNLDFAAIFQRDQPSVGIFVPTLNSAKIKEEIFKPASLGGFFNFTQSWFIICNENSWSEKLIQETFSDLDLKMNSDITIAVKMKNASFQLYDIYRNCGRDCNEIDIEYKGNWTIKAGLKLLPKYQREFLYRRRDFRRRFIKVSTAILEKPENLTDMNYLTDTEHNKQQDMMQRKAYSLLTLLEPYYNFSFDVKFYPEWGIQHSNGTWTGVIGSVYDNETEFSVCPIRGVLSRAKVIHYSPHIHTEHIRFLLRHPRYTSIRNIFFKPLSPTVWWCILALILALTIQLAVHMRHEYRSKYAASTHIESRLDFAALQVLEAILMQGPSPDLYRFLSTRTFIITTCIFSVMLQQFYSAFIVGSLLATPPRTITTLTALFNSSLDIGMEDIPYNYEFFVNATNELVHNIYAQRISKKPAANILNFQRGMERIGRGGFAFHVSLERAYQQLIVQLNEGAFCELQDIAVYAPFSGFLITRMDSVYRDYIAMGIMKLRETGLMQYIDNLWSIPKIDCSLVQSLEVEVDLEHFSPALVLLSFAMVLSAGVFILELLWKWRQKQLKFCGLLRKKERQ